MVAAALGRGDPIEARARLLAKRLNDLNLAANGRGGVVATHQADSSI